MNDKSKLTAIILVVITILVVIISALIPNKDTKESDNKIRIVTNYSNFYTVNSCLYRVITYVASENKNDVMKVLDDNYKKKNDIKENDVLSLFPSVDQSSTFVSTKMYYQKMPNHITRYYVEGYIEKNEFIDGMNSGSQEQKNEYFIVNLDSENKIFSIEPYSGEIFMDGGIDEK